MKSSSEGAPLRPGVLKLSLAIAVVAWLLLAVSSFVAAPAEDFRLAMIVATVGWPLVYCADVFMVGVAAELALRTEKTDLCGPAKDLQFRAIGPFVWFCNATIVIFPAAAAGVAILGIIGLLPAQR